MDILRVRSYDDIEVSQIALHAHVGRSTFYKHYRSKDDLLFAGFDRWVRTLGLLIPEPGQGAFAFSLPLLQQITKSRGFAHAALNTESIRGRFHQLLVEVIEEHLGEDHQGAANAVAGAFIGIASWWRRVEPNRKPEEVDRVFQQVVKGAMTID